MLRIGLTGGIGSGKSTVASLFSEVGVPVLDLDRVGRELAAPGSEALSALVNEFGDQILAADGRLDRAALARHCFADAGRTAALNAIMHPRIRAAEDNWVRQQQSQYADYAIIEASVLIESGGAGRMDAVIVVLAGEDIRMSRVLARGDRSCEAVADIMRRQCSDDERRAVAEYVIVNDGGLDALREQFEALKQLLEARSRPL